MFFKNKKRKSDSNPDQLRCQSPTCPSPNILHPKENMFQVDGTVMCMFCYTKHIAENTIEKEFETSITKKVNNIETSRIAPTMQPWEFQNGSKANLTRIAPSNDNEKYTEELNIWTNLLKHFKFDQNHQQIKKITKLSQIQRSRLIETAKGSLVTSVVTKSEQILKDLENQLASKIFKKEEPTIIIQELQNLPQTIKNWFEENKMILLSESNKEQILVFMEINDAVVSIEELTASKMEYLNSFMYELGKYFYFLQFIGCLSPYQIFFTMQTDSFSFYNANYAYDTKQFNDSKAALQHLYLTIPFMLDDENIQQFREGANSEQKRIETECLQDSNMKQHILNFFTSRNIKFDETKPLPSIRL